ncbi:MAG: DUF4270 family protein [Alistipes sp.]|nr:DUF4270 family protein [Alistipes sp.]
MKSYANLRRLLNCVAAISIAAIALFSGCTTLSDDTLGFELIPENQRMQIRFKSFYAGRVYKQTFDKEQNKFVTTSGDCRSFRTTLYRSDSLVSSDLRVGYMGRERDLDKIFGERSASFASNFLFMSDIEEKGFGYLPIFDSMQVILSVTDFAGDTTHVQTYEVYEVNRSIAEAVDEGKDSAAYINYDMEKLYDSSKPLFTFQFPNQAKGVYTTTTEVTMQPTSLAPDSPTWNFVRRLMLVPADTKSWDGYADDVEVYKDDKKWVNEFKGLYIKAKDDLPTDKQGAMYKLDFSASGLYLLGRNRNPEDPKLIKDTTYMFYYFYDKHAKEGNRSINGVEHDFAGAKLAEYDMSNDPAKSDDENHAQRVDALTGYISGMGGPVMEIYFTDDFLRELRAISVEEGYRYTAINQALMSVYVEGAQYNWLDIVPELITPLLDESIVRMGLYTDFDKLSPIPDYNYSYEKTYSKELPFGGNLNRSRASYMMDISGYVQWLKNYVDYLNPDNLPYFNYEQVYNSAENKASEKYIPRRIYMAPEAYNLYTLKRSRVLGMESPDITTEQEALKHASIKINLSYTMIK